MTRAKKWALILAAIPWTVVFAEIEYKRRNRRRQRKNGVAARKDG